MAISDEEKAEAISPVSDRSPLRPLVHKLGWILIPVLIATICLLAIADPRATWNPPGLIPALNVIFLASASFFVSLLAAESYLKNRSTAALLLGGGTLALGMGATLTFLPPVASTPNSLITIYNTSALVAGMTHLLGVVILSTSLAKRLERGWTFLLASYATIIVVIALILALVLNGTWPVYFTAGTGQTDIGRLVLYVTIISFSLSSILLAVQRTKEENDFSYWYSLGLALIAVGLFGVSLQSNLGDPLNWVGRTAQYLGTALMVVAVIASIKKSGTWLLPLEKALRESEGRYQSLVNMSPDAIIVLSGGKYVFANAAAVKMVGASSPEDLASVEIMAFVDPAGIEQARENVTRMFKGENLPPWESRLIRMDGASLDVEVTGSKIDFESKPALLFIIRDITQRKKAEEALKSSEERFRLALLNAPVSVASRIWTSATSGDIIRRQRLRMA